MPTAADQRTSWHSPDVPRTCKPAGSSFLERAVARAVSVSEHFLDFSPAVSSFRDWQLASPARGCPAALHLL
jgi:hypothetical protein